MGVQGGVIVTAKRFFGWVCVVILAAVNGLVVELIVQSAWMALLVLVAVTVVVLSPIGAWFMARSMGGRRPTEQERAYIESHLKRVLGSENGSYNLRLWVLDQPYPNAWAFGLNQLGVTRGLMEVATEEEFAGVLAHEVGHLKARHTLITGTAWAVSAVGNIAAAIVGVIGTFIGGAVAAGGVSGAISSRSEDRAAGFGAVLFGLLLMLAAWAFKAVTRLVNWLGQLVFLAFGRMYEYEADEEAVKLGQGPGLHSFLRRLEMAGADVGRPVGLLAAYTQSHPPLALRIERIAKLLQESPELQDTSWSPERT